MGEAEPLMPLERPKPLVWGAVKEAKRPAACIPDDRGRLAPLAGEGRGGVVRRVKWACFVENLSFFDFARQIQRAKSCRPHQRAVEPFFRLPGPWVCLDLQKRALRPLRAAVARLVRGAGPAFFLINRFFGLSITTNLSGIARTRAGLSGRPTCRPGAFCPGLSAPQGWPLAAMPAGLPVGTLRPCLTSAVDQPRAASAALRSAIWP